MAIIFDEKEKVFYLHTKHTSYVMGLYQDVLLSHMYWGRRIRKLRAAEAFRPFRGRGFSANDAGFAQPISSDVLPMEYACEGGTDHRYPALEAKADGVSVIAKPEFRSYRISKGKPSLPGLPAVYTESEDEAESLEIRLEDAVSGLAVCLLYSVYPERDVLTRSVRIENHTGAPVDLTRVLSVSVDFDTQEFDFLHLNGAWARERHVSREPVFHGTQLISSARGASSHAHNPFFALLQKETTEAQGACYGFSFVYSGEFVGGTELDPFGICRAFMGINPQHFSWRLEDGDTFQAPEVVMVYSEHGIGGMSRIYHDLYRTRLCRGKYRDIPRPVLINNWEATYFNFNEDKILAIAKKAKEIGVELMVLDDGWFGKRNDDRSSLGDWVPDRNKLPDGITGLADKIEALGMRFGLWFEPEMISPDSELHKQHPDWHIHIPGRNASCGRHEWILDLSRPEVRDYVTEAVAAVLRTAKISYVKWDMNRNMAELGSASLPAEQLGSLCHRYILGLYEILETLTQAFPGVLFESCSGGGGRFDPGMLYYMPQVWTSDCTDGLERLLIQYGTSIVYPAVSMGAHVAAVPNHQVHRTTPLKLRGEVAMMGQFGFELDLNTLTDAELAEAKAQIARYKKVREVIHYGEMYRIQSPFEGNMAAWVFVSQDQNTAVLCSYTMLGKPNPVQVRLKLAGLDPEADYVDQDSGICYGGDELMSVGLLKEAGADMLSEIRVFQKKQHT